MKEIDVDALFLGPKSENQKFFKEMLKFLMDEHIYWRKDFHPEDRSVITRHKRNTRNFQETLAKTEKVLLELAAKLTVSSNPWFSSRYLGHMNSDVLMVATLGYMATILYNPNNCAYEASPPTTEMELEVGRQLALMLGYNPEKAWGHITSGGTVANYEAIWCARNMKSIPGAIKKVVPELVKDMDHWKLLNLSPPEILDLLDKVKKAGLLEEVRKNSIWGKGMAGEVKSKILIPQSKHYSWNKAADIFGLGEESLVNIPVRENYRIDIDKLEEVLDELREKKIPVLCVVSVAGSTEEGSVDEIHKVVELREKYKEKGLAFYYHIDAAYGGYCRSIFLDENNEFLSFKQVREMLLDGRETARELKWPSRDVYDAFKAMGEADSITVDSHKMGYVPYSAGAIVFKDKRILELISYHAAYVTDDSENETPHIGSYIMEGSKPGATAAAVWAAHKTIPLNIKGYGRIMERSLEATACFYSSLVSLEPFTATSGKKYFIKPLTEPDFNIVVFAFNEVGNKNLEFMNNLNEKIYEKCSYRSGPLFLNDFITSKTYFTPKEYGQIPGIFVQQMGIPLEEWNRVQKVYLLRSCVLTPFLAGRSTYEEYWKRFIEIMRNIAGNIA